MTLNSRNTHLRLALVLLAALLSHSPASSCEKYADPTIRQRYPQEVIRTVDGWNERLNGTNRIYDTCVEIDQLAFYDNIRLIKTQVLGDDTKLMAIMKSDAYGHGLELLGKIAELAGADAIGITRNSEIKKLRSEAVTIPIVRVRLASDWELKLVHDNPETYGDVEEMVGNYSMAAHLSELGEKHNRKARVHINTNSGGMSRNGFDLSTRKGKKELAKLLRLEHITVAGIMTHFPNADAKDIASTRRSLNRFLTEANWIMKKGDLQREQVLLHVANTSATLRLPESHLDMVRTGSLIFGEKTEAESPAGLKPVMAVYSNVGQIVSYPKGSAVGYGSKTILEKDSILANIPIGKNNGLPPNLTQVLIRGQRFNLVGKMSMNTTMVDISSAAGEVKAGDPVVFMGTQGKETISAEHLWKSTETWISTIHCNIGHFNRENRYPKKIPLD